jgi:glycosyltransferase involved in cell wall biosynthesis
MISIALAAYNGEKYIHNQIDSILNQTYQDFEIVACDDKSTDSTWNILQEYEKRDARIHCFLNEVNLGFKKNFEKAILLCKGDYIALSDQDDEWTVDHLKTLLQNIGDNMICCGDAEIIDKDGNSLGYKFSDTKECFSMFTASFEEKLRYILYKGNPYQGASMLLSRKSIAYLLPLPDTINFHDAWFALCANALNAFFYMKTVITKYRQHGENITTHKIKLMPKFSLLRTIKICCISIKNYFRGKSKLRFEDRIYYCPELLKRFPQMDAGKRKIIEDAFGYYKNRTRFLYRLFHIKLWVENYHYFYFYHSYPPLKFFPRLIKHLLFLL